MLEPRQHKQLENLCFITTALQFDRADSLLDSSFLQKIFGLLEDVLPRGWETWG